MKAAEEFWKKFWNERAARPGAAFCLNRQSSVQLEGLEREALAQLLQAVDPGSGDVILDAGCGSGLNLALLSSRARRIVGIDYSEEMIKRAKEMVEQEGCSNVEVRVGDVTALDFPSGCFDKVLCASVLQYLDDERCRVALMEMMRVCRPGGRLVLHVKNSSSAYGLSIRVVRGVARCMRKRTMPDYYRRRAWYHHALTSGGGRIVDYDGFGILTFVPLPDRVVEWLLSLEMRFLTGKWWKRFAVNYKITIEVNK
jgi:ubiquinone/menaquinone biosynthesis C-methylase UbiE